MCKILHTYVTIHRQNMANHACITKRDPCRLNVFRRTMRYVLSAYQNTRLDEQEEWNKQTPHSISL